ncbi:hypothetical protein [Mucilaginibacter sp. L3T2-6]|uniref:hypothetical protein n=1 Tax=Mucilaginibacter sp. L3T2-6 TaxID=3062491 RepID=UPI0026748D40|nr:hypothetical protein [Mucilaginibacter sp. L3T2-6]MDO3644691.1 hypothetical protein [Mucilaginibacter sp. L3T2-6]MDV6217143.1 hypothetical protein [Mucilaginibacter sp. L3T2-6]
MTTAAATEPVNWSNTQKIAFRFCFLLFTLFILFDPNGLPFVDEETGIFYLAPLHKLIVWIAAHILHLAKPITVFTNGSGDTTYDYLVVLLIAFLSTLGAIIWSITGRNTRNYNKMFYWLTVVIRYYVAINMVSYGVAKVIKLQFPSPSLHRLLQPLGNMSPMGLAWTYMGFSTGFNYFTGFAELITGLLLFNRKTTTLGAVVGLAVTGNIMAINYCFDVPVKIVATALVLMCLFILIRDTKRLVNFFFTNKDAQPSNLSPHRFKAKWKNVTLAVFKWVLILYVLLSNFNNAISLEKTFGEKAPKPPLYGIYDVESFVVNRDTIKPLKTDTIRWDKLIIGYPGVAEIKFVNDSAKYWQLNIDQKKHTATANTYTDTLHKYLFTYAISKTERKNSGGHADTVSYLTLSGTHLKDSLSIKLRRMDEKKFRLISRGFHWINEYPYNR